jgi:hypothetical protein
MLSRRTKINIINKELGMTQAIISTYAALQKYIISILTGNISTQTGNDEEADSENAPHGAFWATLSYTEFVDGTVPNIGVPILEKGSSKTSNLILALQGLAPFDGSDFPRMPADGPPFFTPEQIEPIAVWIDAGCPE